MDNLQYQFKNKESEIKNFMKSDPYFSEANSMLDSREKLVVADLKMRQNDLVDDTQHFMEMQMVQINYKKNVCMLTRCYDNIYINSQERNLCARKCAFG